MKPVFDKNGWMMLLICDVFIMMLKHLDYRLKGKIYIAGENGFPVPLKLTPPKHSGKNCCSRGKDGAID